MCYMFVAAPGKHVDPELVLGMREQGKGNKDGFGVAYIVDGHLVVEKTLATVLKEIAEFWEEHQAAALAAHSVIVGHHRRKTLGPVNLENVQPFDLLRSDELEVVMFHNGTIDNVQKNLNYSDSWNYAKHYLGPTLTESPGLLDVDSYWLERAALLNMNKVIILTNTNILKVLNSKLGRMVEPGLWGSKPDTIKPIDYKTGFAPPLAKAHSNPVKVSSEIDETVGMGSWDYQYDGMYHYTISEANKMDEFPLGYLTEQSEEMLLQLVKSFPEKMAKTFYGILTSMAEDESEERDDEEGA